MDFDPILLFPLFQIVVSEVTGDNFVERRMKRRGWLLEEVRKVRAAKLER